jgi:hypothetical protein
MGKHTKIMSGENWDSQFMQHDNPQSIKRVYSSITTEQNINQLGILKLLP